MTLQPLTTVIVTASDPNSGERIAVATLREQLLRVYGTDAGFRIIHDGDYVPAAAEFVLAVGRTTWATDDRLATLSEDGYVLKRQGAAVVMAGVGELGSLFAAVAFLDHCAGVRFYMPFDLFTSRPEATEVTVDALDFVSEPFATSVSFSGINMDDKDGYKWMQRVGGWRRKGGTHQHNSFAVFPPERYAERYPDLYPLIEGTRYIPTGPGDQTWQPNFLSEHAVDAAMESATDYFARHPEASYMTVSINDGGRFDDSEATRAVVAHLANPDDPWAYDRALGHIYWSFMSRLAVRMQAEFPGKLLVGLAYGATRFPPTEPLPDNVVPFANFHIGELPTDGFLDPQMTAEPSVYQWLKVAKHFGNHDWYQGSGYAMPRFYTGHWRTYMQFLKSQIDNTFVHVECYPNWGFDGPKYYLLSKLLWNPDVDTQALLGQFCQDMFGPAATPMAAYFNDLETLWVQLDTTDGPERKLSRWTTQFRTTPASRAMIAGCRAHLAEAARLAATDDEKQRVAWFADFFALSDGLFRMAESGPLDNDAYNALLAMAESLPTQYPRAVMHPQRLADAVRELQWQMHKSVSRPVSVPRMAAPTLDGEIGTAEWQAAAVGKSFMVQGGTADRQQTLARIGHDEQMLYVAVDCPRIDKRDYVETPDSHWRSDNIELKFDTDEDRNTPEGHMWIKTTGTVVNHSQRKDPDAIDLHGAVRKADDRYTVEVAIPFTFFGFDPTEGAEFDLQIIRNEFTTEASGYNRDTYAAVWSLKVKLD